MLPFKRIAIFHADLVLPRPWEAMSDSELEAALSSWMVGAQEQGADAFYFRGQNVNGLRRVLDSCTLEGPVRLIPFAASELACIHDAVHYRGRDPWGTPVNRVAYRGCSCHSEADLERAIREGMDYVFYSPVFPTRTHPEAIPLGLDHLAEICEAYPIPIFALGGINQENAEACMAVGADGIAGIRMFL